MTSKDIYNSKPYIVYHITYDGNLLPSNYIGSTSLKRIESGYMGSVSSKKYKQIWNKELKEHPELFHLEIISYHDTRREAIYKELQIHKLFNVVKNPLFVNMTYATVNGYCGMDVSGSNNPNYKNHSQSGISTYINTITGEKRRLHISSDLLKCGDWIGITKNKNMGPHSDQRKLNISKSKTGVSVLSKRNRINCLDLKLNKIYSITKEEFEKGKGIRYFGPNHPVTKEWKQKRFLAGN